MVDVEKMAATAEVVGREREELDEAVRVEREKKAEILARVIEAVHPALKALSSRIQVGESQGAYVVEPDREWMGGPHARGLLVAVNGNVDPKTGHPRPRDGLYSGKALFLSEAGVFVALHYNGQEFDDSDPDGMGHAWTSEIHVTDDHDLIVERKWPVGEIVERIARALDQQLGGKMSKRTVVVEENIEKLRAVATLLKGIEKNWR